MWLLKPLNREHMKHPYRYTEKINSVNRYIQRNLIEVIISDHNKIAVRSKSMLKLYHNKTLLNLTRNKSIISVCMIQGSSQCKQGIVWTSYPSSFSWYNVFRLPKTLFILGVCFYCTGSLLVGLYNKNTHLGWIKFWEIETPYKKSSLIICKSQVLYTPRNKFRNSVNKANLNCIYTWPIHFALNGIQFGRKSIVKV